VFLPVISLLDITLLALLTLSFLLANLVLSLVLKENQEENKKQRDTMMQMMDAMINQSKEDISVLNSTVAELTAEIGHIGKYIYMVVAA